MTTETPAQCHDGASPALIALSGSVADVARHASSAVFDHAFAKPVNLDRLLDILARFQQG